MVDLSALAGLDELPEGMAFEAGQGMAFGGGR
jgi:hypothetical protein